MTEIYIKKSYTIAICDSNENESVFYSSRRPKSTPIKHKKIGIIKPRNRSQFKPV